MILSIKDLAYTYDKKKMILNKINLEVAEGEIISLVGPNGSGKTTLISIIFEILNKQKGTIEIAGYNYNLQEARQSSFLLTSEDYLPEFLTGNEYLEYMAKMYCAKLDNKEKLIKLYSMEEKISRVISEYSHGMKKKLQLIAALLISPRLLAIDETLNGIDLRAQNVTKTLLDDYVKKGGSIVLCTHELELAVAMGTRIVILNKGEILEDIPREDLAESKKDLAKIMEELLALDQTATEELWA